MPTWTGWQNQFLGAIGAPKSADNRGFLNLWAVHANTNCQNNPIDLSHADGGSTDCETLPGAKIAQAYPNHAAAVDAFKRQVGGYENLALGLAQDKIADATASGGVISDLRQWGSTNYATWLEQQATAAGLGPGSATGFHKGWHDLRRSVNSHFPAALKDANKSNAAALRSLRRARKVRL